MSKRLRTFHAKALPCNPVYRVTMLLPNKSRYIQYVKHWGTNKEAIAKAKHDRLWVPIPAKWDDDHIPDRWQETMDTQKTMLEIRRILHDMY